MTRDELIEKAAEVIHRESAEGGRAARCARALAEAGLLAEPEQQPRRCCTGPFADGGHATNCRDACQDCGGAVAGPRRCRCAD